MTGRQFLLLTPFSVANFSIINSLTPKIIPLGKNIYLFFKGLKEKEKSSISHQISAPTFPFSLILNLYRIFGLESRQGDKEKKVDDSMQCPSTKYRGQSRLQPVSAYVDRLVIRSIAPGIENRESGLLIEIIRNKTPYVCCTTIISSCLRDVVCIHFAPIHRNCI